ncbi:MAG: DUF4382 domain-containing protein [Myxococcales bacterium]|nr:DUF4382 domain-containing protein [Myxococcales bacterium]
MFEQPDRTHRTVIARIVRLAAPILVAVPLLMPSAACDTNLEPSRLSLSLTVAAAKGVETATLFVSRLEVHVDDVSHIDSADPKKELIDNDDKWHKLELNQAIELAGLQSETNALALGEVLIPDGRIDQIRLFLNSGKPNTATVAGKVCDLVLAKVPKAGIKISQPFKAFRSGRNLEHTMILHLPLDKALHVVGTCFELQPVFAVRKFQTGGKNVVID